MRIPGIVTARTVALAATAAVAATFLISACDTSGAAVAGGTGQCTTAPGVTTNQINLGMIYPASGLNAQALSPYRAGVDARLGVANAQGGVNGRTLNDTWADDQGQAQPNLAAAQHLVTSDDVFAVQEFSPAPQGSAAWLNREGVPVVGTSNDLVWTQYRNMFSYLNLITSNAGSISTWGAYARGQDAGKAIILYSRLVTGSRLVGQELNKSLVNANIPTQMVNVDPNVVDIPTLVNNIKNSGADFITGVIDPREFIEIAVGVRAAVPTMKILSLTGYDTGVFAVGRQLAGMGVSVGYIPFELPSPQHKVFLNAMAEYSPEQRPATNEIALSGWLDTDLMLRGLQAAGRCPTRQSFMTNLREVSNYDAGGLLAKPVDMRTVFGQLTLCYGFLKIAPNGKAFVPVGSAPLCGQRLP
ncbi:MAG: ABC transporter substrate-binding protein [Frankia sp.]